MDRPPHRSLSGGKVSLEKAILLLGRRDEPTDGMADYCEKLREAGVLRGFPSRWCRSMG